MSPESRFLVWVVVVRFGPGGQTPSMPVNNDCRFSEEAFVLLASET